MSKYFLTFKHFRALKKVHNRFKALGGFHPFNILLLVFDFKSVRILLISKVVSSGVKVQKIWNLKRQFEARLLKHSGHRLKSTPENILLTLVHIFNLSCIVENLLMLLKYR